MIYDSPGFSIGSCLLAMAQNYRTPQLKCVGVADDSPLGIVAQGL